MGKLHLVLWVWNYISPSLPLQSKKLGNIPWEMFVTCPFLLKAKLPLIWPRPWMGLHPLPHKVISTSHYNLTGWDFPNLNYNFYIRVEGFNFPNSRFFHLAYIFIAIQGTYVVYLKNYYGNNWKIILWPPWHLTLLNSFFSYNSIVIFLH